MKPTKENCLIVDIETSSRDPDGNWIDIRDFKKYIKYAQSKWIGFYSYKVDKYYNLKVVGNEHLIIELINAHDTIIGFNSDDFDLEVMKRNKLMPSKYMTKIDVMRILGNNVFVGHKNRGALMGLKFKSNSLKNMAKAMELETQKGDIDYEIFRKDFWSPEEEADIIKYLQADVEVTKQMFDKLFDFWHVFSGMISDDNVRNWSWIKSSIASLTYKYACNLLQIEETYGDPGDKEDQGGRVIMPRVDEAWDVWYIDVRSLYPHMYAMFNLFAEVEGLKEWEIEDGIKERKYFAGNKDFPLEGVYDITKQHPLGRDIMEKLKERIRIKSVDPDNPLGYAYKILLNALYGAQRSAIFEGIHTTNGGRDCCIAGQNVNRLMEEHLAFFNFETLSGHTDSIFVKCKDEVYTEEGQTRDFVHDRERSKIEMAIKSCVNYIQSQCPFPQETFDIEIETGDRLDYIMYPKNAKGDHLKANYAYIYKKKGERLVKLVGLPIKKSNASKLAPMIFKKFIEPRMLDETKGRFEKVWLVGLVDEFISVEEAAQTYKPKSADSYKPRILKDGTEVPASGITAQIARAYPDSQNDSIVLVKNKKFGRLGSALKKVEAKKKIGKNDWFYCTLEEAAENGVTTADLDRTKIYNELRPFCVEDLK